jgi:hypothetical protein
VTRLHGCRHLHRQLLTQLVEGGFVQINQFLRLLFQCQQVGRWALSMSSLPTLSSVWKR